MRTIATDPLTRDWTLTRGRLSLVSGVAAIAERLRGRLGVWAGEWFADLAVGVPYLAFLGQKGGVAVAEATLRRVVVTCPGVASLDSFRSTFDAPSRNASVAFVARAADGTVIPGFQDGYALGVAS